MRIPFVGQSYTTRSLSANSQRSVNCFLEYDNSSPRAPFAMYGTPGLVLRVTAGTAPIRGAVAFPGGAYSYWVAGNTVYRMSTTYALTSCGTIGTSSGQVGMATNGTEVLIVDGSSGWLVTGTTLTQITDVDFPDTVTRCAYQDGYFLVVGDVTQKVYWCETPGSGAAWNGLDFASAEGTPEDVMAILSDHRELWLFKPDSIEIWLNTGDPDQLFQRSGNTLIQQGCAAAGTPRAMNNTVYWMGAGKDDEGIVFKAEGYTPIRISTHAMEQEIGGYSTVSDAVAFCYQIEGHSFYALTFPSADATWVYDAATEQWHEWLWRDPATNELHRHRAGCSVFFDREHLVGDWETGEIYGLDPETYTDNTDPIQRIRTTQSLSKGRKVLKFGELEVDMEVGVGLATGQGSAPLVMLRYSDDDGRSWSNVKTCSMGAAGEYDARIAFYRLGQTKKGKGRVWELSMTDPVKFALFGADAAVREGS